LRSRNVPTTGHGLRHTFSAAAQAAGASPLALARIGGWSLAGSSISVQALEYGRSAQASELVDGLAAEARKIWAHLLPAEGLRLVATR